MSQMAIVKEVGGRLEEVCQRVTEAIKPIGFGVLTQIDFSKKIKEKLGEDIRPCVILGACNPKLAYEAYKQSSDVALVIPCNIVVTQLDENQVKVEALRPSLMLEMLPAVGQREMVEKIEQSLRQVIQAL